MALSNNISLVADTALTTTIGAALTATTAIALGVVSVPAITRRIFPKSEETHLADFLPFEAIASDGCTVVHKDGKVSRYYLLNGLDQTLLDRNETLAVARHRKDFLDAMAEHGGRVRVFTQRIRFSAADNAAFDHPIAREVATKWNTQFETAYRTVEVVAVTTKTVERLEEVEQSLTSTLNAFGVHRLSQDRNGNLDGLTLGAFLGRQCAPVTQPAPSGVGANLADALAADVAWFRPDGIMVFSSGQDTKYAVALGIKALADESTPALASDLSALPMELTVSRYIAPMGRAEATLKLEQHSRIAMMATFNPTVGSQFADAMSMVDSSDDSRSALCTACQTVIVFADSLEQLKSNESQVRQIITANGATPAREAGASQAAWFLQFPTLNLTPRSYQLFTYSLAFDFLFDRPSPGLPRSDWGEGAIARFRTAANTVYRHQFHISDQDAALGHGVVIAPTGAGKTVLMEFLSLMASRHGDLRHFFFDRYRGTAIYTLAMGGKYLSLNNDPLPWSVSGGMNPFDCEDTEDNRTFLKLWLSSISRCDDTASLREISDAIDLAFEDLDRAERSLSTIYDAGFSPNSPIKTALADWVSDTGYGPIFNADKDTIDIDSSWLTTFDMTKLLEDSRLGAATVHYLMHKIRNTLRTHNAPGFIFIDETEPLLRDPNFRSLFKVALQEFRKMRGVVISVFQRPEAIAEAGVSQLVRQQSGTYYLFQNPGAKAADYREFELTPRELDFVLGQSPLARQFRRAILVKRPLAQESVILDVDLSALGPHLKIFSSSSSDIGLVSELYRKMDHRWIERYLSDDAP